ncbi:uncharacterized protein BO96DRAFT_347689 [Aspergillus niger CBS 101883]|uniref:Uncharacterized protein n=2 Tax=Aspergillus niger TaxID=5061 RepID=A2QL99_ASPNC|nr:uncharacterized protein BO96DRAFT_347689 [Aspergillus niger CBS 101883]XP_059603780.1 hypothetical protein An06g00440 [Aspergillus niger]PYH52428.1 hypothetical protein BO96DRAFT_347689 [Aspergillus niger CBS 101883]CAK44960.1 hypothetical protein An06g00440 [Aspergillus niger]
MSFVYTVRLAAHEVSSEVGGVVHVTSYRHGGLLVFVIAAVFTTEQQKPRSDSLAYCGRAGFHSMRIDIATNSVQLASFTEIPNTRRYWSRDTSIRPSSVVMSQLTQAVCLELFDRKRHWSFAQRRRQLHLYSVLLIKITSLARSIIRKYIASRFTISCFLCWFENPE